MVRVFMCPSLARKAEPMSEPLDLEAIKKRAESATPGPWEWEPPSEDPYPMYDESLIGPVLDGEKFPVQVLSGWGYDASGTNCEPQDREFIAHARTDVPALVAEVERLRAERADIWDAGFEVGWDGTKNLNSNPYR